MTVSPPFLPHSSSDTGEDAQPPAVLRPMIQEIGQQLYQARKARSVTLEQVAQSTRMRLHYLQALEAGDFNALPSRAQARGFLRTYAGYLGLDADSLLAVLDGDGEPAAADATPTSSEVEEEKAAAASPGIAEDSLEQTQAIFKEIGQRLRSQRELLGLSVEEVERHTHLRIHYLLALESGNLNDLPSPVQGRGMLKNYASFLGLDPDPLLLRFAEGLQAGLIAKQAARPKPRMRKTGDSSGAPSAVRRLLSSEFLIGGTLVIFLAAFMVWGAIRVLEIRSEEQAASTAPSVAEVLLSSPDGTPTPSQMPVTEALTVEASPTPEAAQTGTGSGAVSEATGTAEEGIGATEALTPPADSGAPVQIYVTVRQRAWMRVRVDGEVEFEGRVIPGSAYQFAGEEEVEILTGNGAGLQIFFRQQDLGPMGLFGEVVQRVFTPDGMVTPTPTITATGTATPEPSATQAGTPTLQEFITATP